MSIFQAPRPGILPAQSIETLIATGAITSDTPFDPDQVQPASLDLRLSDQAWRVRASFLPGQRKVEDRIADVAMHAIEITDAGVVLEKGCVYIVRLQERLKLPKGLIARANPKSSTGRVDVFVRLLTDQGACFDDVAEGYDGPLYMEVAPQTFSILVRPGTRLNQLRLKAGDPPKLETRSVGVDLQGGDIVGFRGRRHAGVVDLDHIDGHDPRDFWEPLSLRRGELLLDPGEFYILASSDDVEIPVDQAAEMTPSIRRWASFAFTTPASSTLVSARTRRMARARRAFWKSAPTTRRSCWNTARSSPAWSTNP